MVKRAAVQDRTRVSKKSKPCLSVENSRGDFLHKVDHCAADVPLLSTFPSDVLRSPAPSCTSFGAPKAVEAPSSVAWVSKTEPAKIHSNSLATSSSSEIVQSRFETLQRAVSDFGKSLVDVAESVESRLSKALGEKAALDGKVACLVEMQANAETARGRATDDAAVLAALKTELSSVVDQLRECQTAKDVQFTIVRDGATVFMNGVFEKPSNPKHAETLMPLFEKIGLEDSLVSAFPSAAAQLPAARTDFMHTVIGQVEQGLLAHIAVLDSKLAAGTESALELGAAAARASEAAALAEAMLGTQLQHSVTQLPEEEHEAAIALSAAVAALEAEADAARRSARDFDTGPATALRDWMDVDWTGLCFQRPLHAASLDVDVAVCDDAARFGGA